MSEHRTDAPVSSFPTVHGFEIYAEERRDRLGVVYRCRQPLHRRDVALRLIDDRALGGGRDLTALCRSARDAARLHHPNLVPLLEVGDHDGQVYLASDQDPEPSLRQKLSGAPMPAEEAARIMAVVARAVQHLHDHHVLHLGLTSARIFLEEATPFVGDLGLAEILQPHPHVPFPGEPAYAAPEQIAGQKADAKTDVFGLGAVLYECLTGQPPFFAKTDEESTRLAAAGRWRAPREVNHSCPPALDRICCKALAARPARRYASAAELAEDLERFDRGEAAGPGLGTRVTSWTRRHPVTAALSVALVLLIACSALFGTLLQLQINAMHAEAESWRRKSEDAALEVKKAHDDKAKASEGVAEKVHAAEQKVVQAVLAADQQRKRALDEEGLRKQAEKQRQEQAELRALAEEKMLDIQRARDDAVRARSDMARQLDRLHVGQGAVLIDSGDYSGALTPFVQALAVARRERLPEETHRLRIAALLSRLPHPLSIQTNKKGDVKSVRFSPDGKRYLVIGADGVVRVRGADTGKIIGKRLVHEAAVVEALFSPNGGFVLSADAQGRLRLWKVEDGAEVFDAVALEAVPAYLAFSGDGKRFVTVSPAGMDGSGAVVQVRGASNGEAVGKPFTDQVAAHPAALSRDGGRILLCCTDHKVRLLDVSSGKQVGPALAHDGDPVAATFSGDGRLMLTTSSDGKAHIWDKSGKEAIASLEHNPSAFPAAMDESGRIVVTAGKDGSVRFNDTATGKPIGPGLGPRSAVRQAVLCADGRHVLTADADGAVRYLEVATGEPSAPPLMHPGVLHYIALSPDGTRALTFDGTTNRVWDLTAGEPLTAPRRAAEGVVWRPDVTKYAKVQGDTVQLYDAPSNKPLGQAMKHKGEVKKVLFSPIGDKLLTLSIPADATTGTPTWDVRIWDASGKPLSDVMEHLREVSQVSFAGDGGQVLTLALDKRARLWDVKTAKVIGKPLDHAEDVVLAVLSPDGKRLATTDKLGMTRCWDAATGERVGEGMGHEKPVGLVKFSADSTMLATCCDDGTARAWEAATGKRLMQAEHSEPVTDAEFSPDGKWLLTGSADGTARAWSISSGKARTPPLYHGEPVQRTAFSADGRWLLTGGGRTARIWDATNGEPIGPALLHSRQRAKLTRLSLDKGLLTTEAGPGTLWTRPLASDRRAETDLADLARVLSGREEGGPGQLLPVGAEDLYLAWDRASSKYASDFYPPRARVCAWARRGASECEARELWGGLIEHLDRLLAESPAPALYAKRAKAKGEMQQHEGALADYDKALAKETGHWEWWAGRGDSALALQQWDRAVEDYTRAAKLEDRRAELWRKLGRAEAERGGWKKAEEALAKAIRFSGNEPEAWYDQALTQLAAGDAKAYRRTCERMVKKFDARGDAAIARWVVETCALAPEALADLKTLVDRAERSARAFPDDVGTQRRLAALLLRAGQAERAATVLDKVASGQEARPGNLWLLVLAHHKAGKADKAKEWQSKAKEANHPEGASWQERLASALWQKEAEAAGKGG